MSAYTCYILCTSPRSGSTLLCSLLRATGVAGHPASWFHEPSLEDWAEDLGVTPGAFNEKKLIAELIAAAKIRGCGGGDLFGLRLQRQSADFFLRTLRILHPAATSDRQRIERCFGPTRFLHLTRPCKIEQAISYVIAQQSGLWHRAADGSELERLAPPRTPSYDPAALAKWENTFTRYDQAWDDWFSREGITPLRLTYENLARDPSSGLRQVLSALGLDTRLAAAVRPGLMKLADETSRDWQARYQRERGET